MKLKRFRKKFYRNEVASPPSVARLKNHFLTLELTFFRTATAVLYTRLDPLNEQLWML